MAFSFSVFAYSNWSKTGKWKDLGMRLVNVTSWVVFKSVQWPTFHIILFFVVMMVEGFKSLQYPLKLVYKSWRLSKIRILQLTRKQCVWSLYALALISLCEGCTLYTWLYICSCVAGCHERYKHCTLNKRYQLQLLQYSKLQMATGVVNI